MLQDKNLCSRAYSFHSSKQVGIKKTISYAFEWPQGQHYSDLVKSFKQLFRFFPGEDSRPVIIHTPDNQYALGAIAPQYDHPTTPGLQYAYFR